MNLRYRPMALMGFTMLLLLIAFVCISSKIAVASLALGVILFVISLAFERIRNVVFPFYLSAVLILSGSVFIASSAYNVNDFKKYYDKECVISGDIVDEPEYSYSRYHYTVKTRQINNDKIKTKVRISVHDKIDADVYDYISIKANVYAIGNENEDLRLYYQSKGVFLGAYSYNTDGNILIESCEDKPLQYKFFLARKTIQNRIIDKLPNDYGGIITGMLTGSDKYISDETVAAIKEAGIAPLFAVSGLHFSIWVMGLFSILDMLKIKKRFNSLVCIIFSLAFIALTGFTPSVNRAGIMLIILLFGYLIYRKTDSLNSLGFAVLVLCIANPMIVSDLGFLLSVSATLGIILIYPFFNKRIISNLNNNIFEKILASFVSVFFVTVCALVGTFPVTVLTVGYFSLFTIVSNLLVSFAATLCMLFGGLSVIFFKISFISYPFALIAGLISKYIFNVVHTIASFNVTVISTDNLYWQIGTVCFVAVSVLLFTFFKNKTAFKATCILLCGIVIFSSCSYIFVSDNVVDFELIDSGNSFAVVIKENRNKYVILGDGEFDFLKSDISERLNNNENNLLLFLDEKSTYKYQSISLIRDNIFNQIVTPVDNQTLNENIKYESVVNVSKSINIDLNDLYQIQYLCTDDYIAAKCIFDKTSLLIIYSSDGITDIPDEFLTADILIFRNNLPQNININSFNEVIVSSDEKSANNILNKYEFSNVPVLSTFSNGDIDIIIKENDYTIIAEVI